MRFVHLHTHSHYSLLDGLSKIDGIIARVKELGMDAVAITDHGNLYGSVEFYKKAKKAGVKPIIGCEVYVAFGSRLSKNPKVDSTRYHLTLLVKNQEGYENLCKLITRANLEGFYYKPRVDRELLAEHSKGLVCLSGCYAGELSKLLGLGKPDEALETAKFYRDLFGEDYCIELQPHNLSLHPKLKEIAKHIGAPIVATQDSHYLRREDQPIHEVLLAIQTGQSLGNSDRMSLRDYDLSLRPSEEMAALFEDAPEAIEATGIVADRCNFDFELGVNKLPEFPLPEGETANTYLRRLTYERLPDRIENPAHEVTDRIEYELGVIGKTGFEEYFLIVQDIVNWAKERGIAVGPGRGSGAGSLVAYLLRITDVNPLSYGLLFERFLNPERIQMPDFDLDFGHDRRDEVLAYLKETYGEERVAQIITFGTMAARAAVRDAGRAMGYPYAAVDRIAKLVPFEVNQDKSVSKLAAYLKSVPELKKAYEEEPDVRRIIDVAQHLEGVARHASVHAAGTVVSRKPLVSYMPLQRAPQDENATVTQFEMHAVEDLGILKIDLLGLKNLVVIQKTIRLAETRGAEIDILRIPLDDPKTYALIQRGGTTGIFQFEGAGMTKWLVAMGANRFDDLIAMVALFRPGPIEFIPTYIARKKGEEPITYLHPKLEDILSVTYGVATYQEQLMRIARDLAGFTLGGADVLRKAVGKKIKSLLDEQSEKFISGVEKTMGDRKLGEDLWRLVEPFARYGFNKAHAVCYALIAYQTAYLKAHYPQEFMTALMNNDAGDVERIAVLIADARSMGIDVLPPDLNASRTNFTIENTNIRFGLLAIKGIGEQVAEAIVAERDRGGPFASFEDFLARVGHRDSNKKSLDCFARCGVFDSLSVERNTIVENLDGIVKTLAAHRKAAASGTSSLFGDGPPPLAVRLVPAPAATKHQRLAWEKELLGLYVSDHPVGDYDYEKGRALKLAQVLELRDGARCETVGLVVKTQRITTKAGTPMLFARLEDLGNTVEVLVFSETLARTANLWQENGIVRVKGRVSRKNGDIKLLCQEIALVKKPHGA